jgi:hypothetical protein
LYETRIEFPDVDGIIPNQFDFEAKRTTNEWIDDFHPVLEEQQLRTTPDIWHKVIIKELASDNRVTLAVRPDNLYIQWWSSKCIVGMVNKRNLMHFFTY